VQFEVETTQGPSEFTIRVHEDWSPAGAARFLELVEAKFYDDTRFYRVIPSFMVQVQRHTAKRGRLCGARLGQAAFIVAETSPTESAGQWDKVGHILLLSSLTAHIPLSLPQFGLSGEPAVNSHWRAKTIQDDPVKESNKPGYVTFAKTGAPNSRTTQVLLLLFIIIYIYNIRKDGRAQLAQHPVFFLFYNDIYIYICICISVYISVSV